MSSSAFVASLRNLIAETLARAPPDSPLHNAPFSPCSSLEIALSEYWQDCTASPWNPDAFLAFPPSHLQQKLFHTKSTSLFNQLIQSSLPLDVIRLHSCAAIGAAAFLSTPQTIPGCSFSNIEFSTSIRLRLGLPLGIPLPSICACGEPSDPHGFHFLKCNLGGEWISRHDSIVHVMATTAKASGFLVQTELPLAVLTPRSPTPPLPGRMDLVVTSGDFNTNILADVTISHPYPSSSTRISTPMTHPLHFTLIKENQKKHKYSHTARLLGASVFPLAIETFGALGPMFQKFLQLCADAYLHRIFLSHPSREEIHRSVIMRSWRSRISCALQKANARLLFSKASRTARANQSGQAPHYVDLTEVFGNRIC